MHDKPSNAVYPSLSFKSTTVCPVQKEVYAEVDTSATLKVRDERIGNRTDVVAKAAMTPNLNGNPALAIPEAVRSPGLP